MTKGLSRDRVAGILLVLTALAIAWAARVLPVGTLARPFNRAEYFIDNTSVTVPPRCAQIDGCPIYPYLERAHSAA